MPSENVFTTHLKQFYSNIASMDKGSIKRSFDYFGACEDKEKEKEQLLKDRRPLTEFYRECIQEDYLYPPFTEGGKIKRLIDFFSELKKGFYANSEWNDYFNFITKASLEQERQKKIEELKAAIFNGYLNKLSNQAWKTLYEDKKGEPIYYPSLALSRMFIIIADIFSNQTEAIDTQNISKQFIEKLESIKNDYHDKLIKADIVSGTDLPFSSINFLQLVIGFGLQKSLDTLVEILEAIIKSRNWETFFSLLDSLPDKIKNQAEMAAIQLRLIDATGGNHATKGVNASKEINGKIANLKKEKETLLKTLEKALCDVFRSGEKDRFDKIVGILPRNVHQDNPDIKKLISLNQLIREDQAPDEDKKPEPPSKKGFVQTKRHFYLQLERHVREKEITTPELSTEDLISIIEQHSKKEGPVLTRSQSAPRGTPLTTGSGIKLSKKSASFYDAKNKENPVASKTSEEGKGNSPKRSSGLLRWFSPFSRKNDSDYPKGPESTLEGSKSDAPDAPPDNLSRLY